MIGSLIAGLISYRIVNSKFEGVLKYLVFLLLANLGLSLLGVSPYWVSLLVLGFIIYLFIGPAISFSKEESRQLALYTVGIAILLPLIFLALGVTILMGVL